MQRAALIVLVAASALLTPVLSVGRASAQDQTIGGIPLAPADERQPTRESMDAAEGGRGPNGKKNEKKIEQENKRMDKMLDGICSNCND